MIKGELTPAAVVLTQRQNFLPPTEQLGPPLTHQGRRYHSGHGSSKKPDMVGIEPETSCAEAYTLTTRPNPTPGRAKCMTFLKNIIIIIIITIF